MITEKESDIIKYIRSISMLCIVLCHIQQVYDNKWAWVFNIGVQIFLAISGWLYGNKNIINWEKWYLEKIKRLYIPYIIYIFIIFIVYKIFIIDIFSFKHLIIYFLDIQWILGSVKGLSHLWFMTAIAICYSLTPVLQYIKNKNFTLKSLYSLSTIGLLNFFIFKIYLSIFSPLFIYTFIYLFANINTKQQKIYLVGIISFFIYTLVTINWISILNYTNYLNILFHVSLGLLCVILPINFSNHIKSITVLPIVRLFDKYSYYIYITHHIFILGPLSCAFITNNILYNVFIILSLTCISTL